MNTASDILSAFELLPSNEYKALIKEFHKKTETFQITENNSKYCIDYKRKSKTSYGVLKGEQHYIFGKWRKFHKESTSKIRVRIRKKSFFFKFQDAMINDDNYKNAIF